MTRETLVAATAAPLVVVRKVRKTFAPAGRRARASEAGVVALDGISLEIPPNAFVTLLGPSGCGKTTLLHMLAGFEHPDAGDVVLDGRSVLDAPPNRRPVNIVFQSYALFPHMSVAENVGFGLAQQGVGRAAMAERVAAMLRLVRLETLGDRRPSDLSGGQQQRVALARALAPAPKLLLLDEPLSALDLKLRRGMQVELKRLQRETGITFLLVTHDQEEALAMSDIVAVMNAGRIEQIGLPMDLYERPASRFVADFFGANILPGDLLGHPSAPHVALRPEQVEIGPPDSEGRLGTVTALAYQGAATAVTIALDEGPALAVLIAAPTARLRIGARVTCRWPASALVPLEH